MRESRQAERLSLDGRWSIRIGDEAGEGVVPGAWERQGYAFAPDRAVYSRAFTVPAGWAGAQVWLQFGAVSYHVEVRVNGAFVGAHEGLWTPFEFDVTGILRSGATNAIELTITRPGLEGQTFPYREVLGGFLPYTAMAFGGPWQSIHLLALRTGAIVVRSIKADWRSGRVTIEAHADGPTAGHARLCVEVLDRAGVRVGRGAAESGDMPVQIDVHERAAWSSADPALYTVRLTLEHGGAVLAETTRRVGFRALEADGERLRLNGAPFTVRGVLSWGWDPDTLAPNPSVESIREEFRRARLLGFNLIKLCLFVPPERLYEIADEEDMLLWLELPLWWQRTTDHLRQQARVEYADILRLAQSHPSIVLYSLGCELDADMADQSLLADLSELARGASCGSLLCDNSGSGEAYAGLATDMADFADYHFYCDLHYFRPLLDHFRRDWRRPRPWIFGEFCDADTFRDTHALDAGGRPWWRDLYGIEGNPSRWAYPEQSERMAALDLPFAHEHLIAVSRRQALVMRKMILERARLRRDVGGYVVTLLSDTPITTSGLFDDFGAPKFAPDVFRTFNADHVLLLDEGRARRWTAGGDRPAPRDLHCHFSGARVTFRLILSHAGALPASALTWRLLAADGHAEATGQVRIAVWSPAGAPLEVATVELTLPETTEPGEWTLEATIAGVGANRWPLWVFPRTTRNCDGIAAHDPAGQFGGGWPDWVINGAPPALLIASVLDADVESFVRAGGRAILLQPDGGRLPSRPVTFWREAINLVCDHPLLRRFPHAGYTDLQFYHLAADRAFETGALNGFSVTPVIRRLDARLFTVSDYVLDLRLGDGRLLASTLRFFGGDGDQARAIEDKPSACFLLCEMIELLMSGEP